MMIEPFLFFFSFLIYLFFHRQFIVPVVFYFRLPNLYIYNWTTFTGFSSYFSTYSQLQARDYTEQH